MARDLSDLAVSASNAAGALPAAQRRGVSKAALFTKNSINVEIRKATGGDMRLSGVGSRGSRTIRARYKMKRTKDIRAEITATGPLHLIERDTSPHRIPRKRGKRARKRYAAFDGKVYSSVNHPGTAGKRPFEKGWKKAAPKTPIIMRREVGKTIAKAWG